MLVVSNGESGLREAWDVLKQGGRPIQAVEAGIRVVEADPAEHNVGFSGYPNLLGDVELDACIMDGDDLSAGAVAAFRWCRHPISVAARVKDELPHLLLVGEGADRFAREMGFPRESLLTPEVRTAWRAGLLRFLGKREIRRLRDRAQLRDLVKATSDPGLARDTVTMIAMDDHGSMASGASTSGWAWKYPGRVGDTGLIGAGSYANSRYGAAACTGRGEMAMRVGAARAVIAYVRMGMPLREACREVMGEIAELSDPYFGWVDLVAVDREGQVAGFTWHQGRRFYAMTDAAADPVARDMELVHRSQRTGRRQET